MNNLQKKLEVFANVAIILAAILLCALITQKLFFSNSSEPTQAAAAVTGTKLSIPNYEWSQHSKTVLLVLQRGCRFCTESAPFYQRLIQETQNRNAKIIAVFSQNNEEAQKYLEQLGLGNVEVRQSTLDSLQVKGTPTLFITDNEGKVLNSWVGKLSSDKEIEVISHLQN